MHEDGNLHKYANTKEVIDGRFVPFEATERMSPRAVPWFENNITEEKLMPGRPSKRTPVQLLHAK